MYVYNTTVRGKNVLLFTISISMFIYISILTIFLCPIGYVIEVDSYPICKNYQYVLNIKTYYIYYQGIKVCLCSHMITFYTYVHLCLFLYFHIA